MPSFGPGELIIVLIIALIVIGPGRLPDVGAALGKSIREFRKASTEVQDSTRIDAPAPPPQAKPAQSTQPPPPSEASTEPRP
jgi:sec-independent protein translocase protein TatA